MCILPETNIASENGWLELSFLLGWPICRGYVSFRDCIFHLKKLVNSIGAFNRLYVEKHL